MTTTIIGAFSPERREALRLACLRADEEAVFHENVATAETALAASDAPRCVIIDGCVARLESFVGWLRGQGHLFGVPVVVVVPMATDGAYSEAHKLGADDVIVTGDCGGVTRRLANLAAFDPKARPPITAGPAVVAHPDDQRRRLLGRILRQAGFEVSFAAEGHELVAAAMADPASEPPLLVASANLPPAGPVAVLREVGASVPMVVLAPRRAMNALREEAKDLRCVVGSDHAPPDHLLFHANELLRAKAAEDRASARLLYGAICAFRPRGSLEPVYGLTYNISREGLFVRTLDPPKRGEDLWFEVRPPRERNAVHLRGKVVWARGLSTPGGASPPGFGMRIVASECPPGDLATFHRAYHAALESPLFGD